MIGLGILLYNNTQEQPTRPADEALEDVPPFTAWQHLAWMANHPRDGFPANAAPPHLKKRVRADPDRFGWHRSSPRQASAVASSSPRAVARVYQRGALLRGE